MKVDQVKSIVLLGSSALAVLLGCAAAPPPPAPTPEPTPAPVPKATAPEPPSKEPLDTGNECVTGDSQCEGGECVLTIKNDCDHPVSCDAAMNTSCKSSTEMIEA